jgi:capsular exopolysaccharide synthesis family protein
MADTPQLPALSGPVAPCNLPAPNYYTPAQQQPEFETGPPPVPLAHYLWILRRQAWKIAAFVTICLVGTFIISERLQPIYESIAVVDIDRQAPSAIVGTESDHGVMALNDSDQFLATQIKLILSDAVLRPVAEKYDLLRLEKQIKDTEPEKAQSIGHAPVLLKRLKVTRPPNTYILLIAYRSPDPKLSSEVANAIANSYVEQTYNLRIVSSASLSTFMEKQLDQLQAKMERSNRALAEFEKELNVINPEEKTNILSARLLQLNTEYTTAQGDRIRKEAAYNSMKSGSLEAAQVSTQGEELGKLTERLNDARQHFAQVKTTFGASHPEYRKAASELAEVQSQFETTRKNIANRIEVDYRQALNREQMLQTDVASTKAESDRLNARSFEYHQLKQEAEADKTLYEELIRKIREAGINAGFQNNNVRIADLARPGAKPVFPVLPLNLALAFVASLLISVGVAVAGDTMDTTVRDPEQTSRYLGTDVIGMLPAVARSSQLSGPVTEQQETTPAKADDTPNSKSYHRKGYYRSISGFEESIRTLRNTILLGDIDTHLRSLLITSAGPGEGKSTIAVHLAIAHAGQGQKTLLVDGDLRRPSVARRFGLTPKSGFSNVLTREVDWKDVLVPAPGKPYLFILPAGTPSHRAADLIGPRMGDLLDEFAREFDLVIMDSPPLLGFAEPLRMAAVANAVIVVSQAGETKRKAVGGVLTALGRVRANVLGVVLNQIKRDTTADGYAYYGYYRPYYYQHDAQRS